MKALTDESTTSRKEAQRYTLICGICRCLRSPPPLFTSAFIVTRRRFETPIDCHNLQIEPCGRETMTFQQGHTQKSIFRAGRRCARSCTSSRPPTHKQASKQGSGPHRRHRHGLGGSQADQQPKSHSRPEAPRSGGAAFYRLRRAAARRRAASAQP